MRIISGIHKGRKFSPPKGLPVRPTTDFAKESLFNILENRLDFEETKVLDLFSGTGNLSFEFASRQIQSIVSIDLNSRCCSFIKNTARELEMPITVRQGDVLKFISKSAFDTFDLIIADPPYKLKELPLIPDLIFDGGWLNKEGLLVLEHGPENSFSQHPFLIETRKYGHVNFSFFQV